MNKSVKHVALILGIFSIVSLTSCVTLKRMPPGQQKKILSEKNERDLAPGREAPGQNKK